MKRFVLLGVLFYLTPLPSPRVVAEVEDIESKVKNLNDKVRGDLQNLIDILGRLYEGIGSTFTRWGRPDCPGNGTELVYSGYVAGGLSNHTGAAVNFLCLTKQQTWNHTVPIDNHTFLYSAVYKFGSSLSTSYFGKNLYDHEPPCAVCRSTRASAIMIPGTNVCTKGWTKEYAGYLVAGGAGHAAASEYICMDRSATTVDGSGSKKEDGKLIYMVRMECGSLSCPSYETHREVTCVVCTR